MTISGERTMNHTPTPWVLDVSRVDDDGAVPPVILDRTGMLIAMLGYMDGKDARNCDTNAAFIVRAVNAHDELVAAAKEALDYIAAAIAGADMTYPQPNELYEGGVVEYHTLATALAKAEGRNS